MSDAWERKPALENAGGVGCLCCGTPTVMFPAEGWIAVGFGSAGVTKDGKEVYSEPNDFDDEDEIWTGADAEKAALADPDHDWRIYKYAPLYEAVYQRHGDGQWVLVERGDGFA
jgi:hypothetical protein